MKRPEIDRHIIDYLEGAISGKDFAALDAELSSNPESRRLFLQYANLHGALVTQAQGAEALQAKNVVPMDLVVSRQKRRSIQRAGIAAAAIAIVGALVAYFIALPEPPVARIEGSPDVDYSIVHPAEGADKMNEVDGLMVGSRVILNSGELELKLTSGVEGVVRAPADFKIVSKKHVDFSYGTAWFEVSEKGKGFQVDTPDFLLTDLGTEFGIIGRADAPDAVHVMLGSVEVVNRRGKQEKIVLGAQDSRRPLADGSWKEIPYSTEAFFASPANQSAMVIEVRNPSFEIVGTEAGDNGNPQLAAGWVATHSVLAYFNPDDNDFAGATDGDATSTTVPDGSDYLAFLYDQNAITQTMTVPVIAGAEYTLTFYVGDSMQFDYVASDGHRIELRTTDGDVIISKTSSDHAIPEDGGFVFVSLTGTAPLDATGNLEIEFASLLKESATLPFIDSVGLEVSRRPES